MNNEEIWLHTKYPRRGFVVVVVSCFDEILDDLLDFFSENVSFPKKNNHQFGGLTFFSMKSVIFYWTYQEKTLFTDENL